MLTGVLLVPLVSTQSNIRTEIYQLMKIKEKDILIDLGSGNGMFLIEAYEKYGIKGIGYEISPVGIFISRILKTIKLGFKNNLVIVPNNFLNLTPLPKADKIYCYLNPKAMKSIEKKLKTEEIENETEIYSYKYEYKNIKKEDKYKLSDGNYLYKYKGNSFNI